MFKIVAMEALTDMVVPSIALFPVAIDKLHNVSGLKRGT